MMYQVYSLDRSNNQKSIHRQNLSRLRAVVLAGQLAKQDPDGYYSFELM